MAITAEKIRAVIAERIPANLVMAEHTKTGHFYRHTPTNQLFASVTTKCGILDSPHLKKWAARLAVDHMLENRNIIMNGLDEERQALAESAVMAHQERFESAGDIGTRGHKIIEDYLKEWIDTDVRPADITTFIHEDDSRLYAIARSAEMFCHQFKVKPIVSEMLVASTKHRFAGTLDSLMMVETTDKKGRKVMEFALVDWKTSNSIDKVEYAMQTSAYWQALYEMTGLRPKNVYIVQLNKEQAKIEVRRLANRALAFKAFKHLATVFDWIEDGCEKLINVNKKERVSIYG